MKYKIVYEFESEDPVEKVQIAVIPGAKLLFHLIDTDKINPELHYIKEKKDEQNKKRVF